LGGGGGLFLFFSFPLRSCFFFFVANAFFLVPTQLSLLSWHIPEPWTLVLLPVASAVCRARAVPNRRRPGSAVRARGGLEGASGVSPAQWCLSCVHTQARFSCKKLRNPLRKVPRKDDDLWKNCGGNADQAARVLWVTLYGVTHKLVQVKSPAVKSRTEPIAMTACDLLAQWSINVDCVTVCVAVVRQLHGLLTAGRLYTPTA